MRSASAEKASGRTLIATSRPRRVSRARYTSPIPPAPIAERMWYGPSLVPAVRVISRPPQPPGGTGPNHKSMRTTWLRGRKWHVESEPLQRGPQAQEESAGVAHGDWRGGPPGEGENEIFPAVDL